jgi:cytochrome P450
MPQGLAQMEIDLASKDSILDPAAYFAEAQRGGPVQWSAAQRGWVILSHEGVEAAFRDGETLSADRSATFQRVAAGRSPAFGRVVELLSGWMNFRDPPAQTRLREPVKAAFTPRAISAMEPEIRSIVDHAIDGFAGEVVDLSHDFAHPIPALVIAAILGVDPEERDRFARWSDDLGSLVFSMTPGATAEEPIVRATAEFTEFFSTLIERERAQPSGNVLSAIVHSDVGNLSPMELVGACTLLLFGGHETTTTLLINALGLLLERPELMAWLRSHPEADSTAVEEFMRVVGPARTMPRKVAMAHERGGQRLEAGQNVFLCIAAANHDGAVFADPGRVDFERDPNPQLGFGWGIHYCLGANLARLEARIALRTLLDRFPQIVAEGPVPEIRASAMGFGRRPLRVRLRA